MLREHFDDVQINNIQQQYTAPNEEISISTTRCYKASTRLIQANPDL